MRSFHKSPTPRPFTLSPIELLGIATIHIPSPSFPHGKDALFFFYPIQITHRSGLVVLPPIVDLRAMLCLPVSSCTVISVRNGWFRTAASNGQLKIPTNFSEP
jgi:hypothetical protein